MSNQASEDELENIFSELCVYMYGNDMGSMTEYRIPRFRLQEAKTAIQSLIRTEKLKLLAEVRERVVGEDKPLQGKYRASGLMSYDMTNHYENSLRAEQRAVLTKLEAEL